MPERSRSLDASERIVLEAGVNAYLHELTKTLEERYEHDEELKGELMLEEGPIRATLENARADAQRLATQLEGASRITLTVVTTGQEKLA